MAQPDLESDLLRGNTPTLILAVLHDSPTHGYEIAKRINAATQNSLAMRQGTLYPVLNGLERDGLVSSQWEHPEGERPRKVFTITPAGSAELERRTRIWARFAKGVNRILGMESHGQGA